MCIQIYYEQRLHTYHLKSVKLFATSSATQPPKNDKRTVICTKIKTRNEIITQSLSFSFFLLVSLDRPQRSAEKL